MRNPFRNDTKRQAAAMESWQTSMEKLEKNTSAVSAYTAERSAVLNGVAAGEVVEMHTRRNKESFDTLLHVAIGEVVEKPPQIFDQDA
jgi:hypothetical protein